jgi:hypothetical protein
MLLESAVSEPSGIEPKSNAAGLPAEPEVEKKPSGSEEGGK